MQMKNKMIAGLAMLILLLGMTVNSNAALSIKDLTTPGDGQLIYDSNTGLSWLKISNTTTHSYNEIISGFGGYITDKGFRYAKSEEVGALLSNYGITQIPSGTYNSGTGHGAVTSFMTSYLGVTWANYNSRAIVGITADIGLGAQTPSHHYAYIYSNDYGHWTANQDWGQVDDNFANVQLSSFLVKFAVPQTNLIDLTYGTGSGSFELGSFVDNGLNYMGLPPGATTITGWTVGGPGDGVDWISPPTYRADTGVHSVDLQHSSNNSSIATVIPTVVGNVYRLTFGAAAVSGFGSNTGMVSAGSLVNQPFAAAVSGSFATQTFTPFTFLFTATSLFTEIRFTATGVTISYGPVIDSVSVVPATDFFGGTLKIPSSYEFTLEQNSQKTEALQLINPGNSGRTASLEIVNPQTDLMLALVEQNPISIAPGETKSLSLTIDDGSLPVGSYDGLLLKIRVDDGSMLYSNIKVNVVPQGEANLPDLTLSSGDIGFAVTNPGDPVTLTATIRNQGKSPASNVVVRFFEFGVLLGETVVPQVAANGNTNTSIVVPMDSTGDHLIRVVIDTDGAIQELDETNNEASQVIQPGGSGPAATEGNIMVSGSLPTTVYTNALFTLTGQAIYDLYVDNTRNTDYVVKGGAVQVTITGDGGAEWVYGDIHTDISGNLVKSLQAPTIPGTYHILMTVTDKTFIGKRELVFNVIEPPPPESPPSPPPAPPTPITSSGIGNWTFSGGGSGGGSWFWTWTTPPNANEPIPPQTDMRVYSENIRFSKSHPAANEEITVFSEIRYWATSTDLLALEVPVTIYVTDPGTPRIKIGSTTIDKMSVGSPDFGSRYVYATWKNRADGIYLIEVEIDPNYVEENKLNNAATRAIIVGQLQSQQGAISGQVTDSWGNGITNAILHVSDATGISLASTNTDPAGFYLVDNVPLGNAQVRIETPNGYQPDAVTKSTLVEDASVSSVSFLLTQKVVQPSDTTPPVLNLPAAITTEATSPAGAIVTYITSALDGVDGNIIPTCTPVSGATFTLGSTSVSCSAIDKSNNTASGSFSVKIQDTTPPKLVCHADVSVVQGQQLNLGLPTGSDIADSAPTLHNNAPGNFPLGIFPVIWTITDFSGNSASCTQQVTVTPLVVVNQPPVANAGSDRTVRQGSLVTLTGTGTDPDNRPSPLTFAWSQSGGSNVTMSGEATQKPTFMSANTGNYTFSLIVKDGADSSAPDEVRITVPLLCDINLNGNVDRNDINLITAARNQTALSNDLRDFDGDGKITVNDARSCVLKCTLFQCATQ
jgi:hypothetical protein